MPNPSTEFTARNYLSLIDSHQLSLLRHFTTPDYVLHFAGMPEPLNLAAATRLIAGIQAAFPDLRHDIQSVSGTNGHVEVQIMARGTQRGDFQGVPATGQSVAVPTTHRFHLTGGQIAEHWIEVEMAEIMRQIGAGAALAGNGATPLAHVSRNEHSPLEANKALVRRVYDELINQENKTVIEEVFAPDAVIHDPFTGVTRGATAFAQLLGMFDTAFPHHRVAVEEIVAEGDFVTVLHTHHATHTGLFMGLPPTGKPVVVSGIELVRVVDGQIVEFWRKDDDASLLVQLGMLAVPQPA